MANPFQPPSDPRVQFVITNRQAISSLTGKAYAFNPATKQRVIQQLRGEDSKIFRASDERLGRIATFDEVKQHLAGMKSDERGLAQRILEDGTFRSNTDRDASDMGGNPILRAADLGNKKLWRGKIRDKMARKTAELVEEKDAEYAAELQRQAEREARESHPEYQAALNDAQYRFTSKSTDRTASIEEIVDHKDRLDRLEAGTLSPTEYRNELGEKNE